MGEELGSAMGALSHHVPPCLKREHCKPTAEPGGGAPEHLAPPGATRHSELGPCKVGGAEQAMAQAQHGAASHLLRSTGTLGQERPRHEDSREQPLRPAPYGPREVGSLSRVLLVDRACDRRLPNAEDGGQMAVNPMPNRSPEGRAALPH